jgi:hypothetical protein
VSSMQQLIERLKQESDLTLLTITLKSPVRFLSPKTSIIRFGYEAISDSEAVCIALIPI